VYHAALHERDCMLLCSLFKQDLVDDPVLFGECLSGALYWNDFLTIARRHGFADPRLVSDSPISINNK
jgi:arsenite methyltransferase